ncbi:MAG: carboxypeptidase-like regulatory domain-containing protein [Pyrinomonadaceae bacterium]
MKVLKSSKVLLLIACVVFCSTFAWSKPLRSGGNKVLTVQVNDRAGRPLRACITVISPEHEVISFCQVDINGRTTIPNLAAEKYRVSAKSAGYVMQQKEIDLTAGANAVSFNLDPKR